jgi:hypothetical protein
MQEPCLSRERFAAMERGRLALEGDAREQLLSIMAV